MNGPIVFSILPNTAMKQSILFFFLAANRGTCEQKRMNETGEEVIQNSVKMYQQPMKRGSPSPMDRGRGLLTGGAVRLSSG